LAVDTLQARTTQPQEALEQVVVEVREQMTNITVTVVAQEVLVL
jgi:hypothetical protein